MSKVPSAVWIVDTNKEHLASRRRASSGSRSSASWTPTARPDLVDFPIRGNDDAIRAVGLLTRVVADAVAEGLIARSGAKTAGEAVGAEEPLAEWEPRAAPG